MTPTLFQHQEEGAQRLAARPTGRGYLAFPPGQGKTRAAIYAAQLAGAERVLVICPAIVRSHWAAEFVTMDSADAWTPIPIVKSYDEITRGGDALLRELLGPEVGIDTLILDEAHYLKHATSKRTKQILGREGYARRVARVWPLSGTPLPKNPAEIWTVLASLFPEVAQKYGLQTRTDFLAKFCMVRGSYVRGAWREKIVGVKNERALQALLDEMLIVCEPRDDVPPLHWQTVRLDVSGDDLRARSDGEADALLEIQAALRDNALADIANDPHVARMRRRIGELKVAPVAEMVKSQLADSDEKLVIFAHHTSVIDGLYDALAGFEPVVVDGRVGDGGRERAKRTFLTDPRCRVFIGQNVACGTGMDGLQRVANRAILVEPSWTASENEQLGRRIARYGTIGGHGVAQMIALAGTLDEAIVAQCIREQEMVAAAMPLGE